MKNLRYLLLSLLAFGVITLQAQTHYESNITVGAKGGTTLSMASFSPTVPQKMLTGMILGATFRYIEERHFGVIAEINLEQRGWNEDFKEAPYEYSRTLTYIQIPLLTHIYFGSTKFHGFFNAGPEFAYMLSESTSANFDINNFMGLEDFPKVNRSNDQFAMPVKNKYDYGISAGLGMEYFIKRNHSLTLEGRFYFGLGNMFGSSKKDVFAASRGMSVQITLGYNFRMK